jgi:hypothetical protein
VLLFFHWLVQYPQYSTLGLFYGISTPVISIFLRKSLPHFVGFFSKFIDNKLDGEDTLSSHLSAHILGIIDGTVHKIRRPSVDQHLWWNENYQFHAVHSLFIVDFEGRIVAVQTGIPGSFHDSCVAKHSELFKAIVKEKLLIGDPGFGGVVGIFSIRILTNLSLTLLRGLNPTKSRLRSTNNLTASHAQNKLKLST